jgi:hypothetical protein
MAIPDHFTTQWGVNFEQAVQQTQSRFRKAAIVETGCTGEAKTHNLDLPIEDNEVTGERFGKTVLQELDTEKRWIRPRMFDLATGEPKWDEELLAPTILPGGKQIQAHSAAYARRTDKVFVKGLLGTNYKGPDGTTATEIPADNIIGVDYVLSGSTTETGLVAAKIVGAKRVLQENEAYNDDAQAMGVTLWGAMTPLMESQILDRMNTGTDKLHSGDYFQRPTLNDKGEITYWMGVNWIKSNNLPLDETDTDARHAAIWTSNAVHLDFWGEITTTVDRRPDLKNAIQFFSQYSMNACRSQDKRVVKILCVEPS